MNGNKILLDTNIIIYLLGGDESLFKIIDNKAIFLSTISELELRSFPNVSDAEKDAVQSFISDCIVVEINPYIKDLTVDLRVRYRLKLPDAIILASALSLDIPMLTADQNFRSIQEGRIIIYEP